MIPFGKDYYYHEGKVYKEIKPSSKDSWRLITKDGKRKWITKKQLESLLQKHHRM